ncbi:hypothetical protein ACVWXS_005114 [Lysinibacillus sp. TE18511]
MNVRWLTIRKLIMSFLALDDSNKNYQGLSTVIVVLKC